jgi:hypothetical protein
MNTIPEITVFQDTTHTALKQWYEPDNGSSPLEELFLYRRAQLADRSTPRQITNNLLLKALEAMAQENATEADLLRKRFLDELAVQAVGNALNMSDATVYRRQTDALRRLTGVLLNLETRARENHTTALYNRLELPGYDSLFGVDDHLAQLTDWLTGDGPARIIAIEGIGGLGKTSLADALVRQLIGREQFEEVGWVSARPQIFNLSGQIEAVNRPPALRTGALVERLLTQLLPDETNISGMSPEESRRLLTQRLQTAPHLVVIDNLETVQDITELLPLLRDLSKVDSRLLLTSRQRVPPEPGVFHFSLPPLSEADTLRLVRYEIENQNLVTLQQATDDDLRLIYQAVGGNPLAVRLVLGQAHAFTLPDILADLAEAGSRSADELYTFIYRRAWDKLNEPTRQIFLAMPLLPPDGEGIGDLTDLESGTVRTALKTLIDLNLVNSQGDHQRRRYSIHNLTRTFLLQQVLKWQ